MDGQGRESIREPQGVDGVNELRWRGDVRLRTGGGGFGGKRQEGNAKSKDAKRETRIEKRRTRDTMGGGIFHNTFLLPP